MNNVDNNKNKKRNVPDLTDKGTEILNVPKLRFKEFEGEWEEHYINEICSEFKSGKNIKANLISKEGKFPVYGGNGLRGYTTTYNHNGAYVLIGRQGALCGNVRIVSGQTYITEHAVAVAGNSLAETVFLRYLFSQMNLGQYSDQSAQPGLAVNKLLKIKVSIPSLCEQKKIAKLLSLLDERIATQNALIDRLQSLMKGLGDELLYNKTWAKIYLKDILAFYPTNSLSWDKLSYENESDIRNLHYGMIHNLNSPILDLKMMPFIKWGCIPQKYELCQNGDVAFADASEDTDEIAKVVEFRKISNEEQVVCGLHTIHGRDIHDITVVGFKGYALNAKYFHQQIKRMAQGTKVFSITASNISNCFVFLPSKDEQKKIVSILDAISLKFQVEAELLNLYKKQKQYLLRQMFI